MFTNSTVPRTLISILILIFSLAVVAVLVNTQNHVLAQETAPDGPVNTTTTGITSPADNGNGLIEVDVPLSNTGDGLPEGSDRGTPALQAQDPLAFDTIEATFSYYRLVGTAFNIRTSTTTFAYNFNGCVYETGGTDNRFMAPLLLPENAVIKYLRIYYDDTNPTSDITAWITRYQPGITSEDLTSVTSTGSSGFGTTLSEEITHTVDLTNWAYTVIFAPNANSSQNNFCGVRVAYYAPKFVKIALPVVTKSAP
ncbi:MAG: hypothetical protein WAV05_08390 [Anaerolineales bacterium]